LLKSGGEQHGFPHLHPIYVDSLCIALLLAPCVRHTFSAFWLRSSVVSVLNSVKTVMWFIEPLFFTLIFSWGWM
jgi:hypothetical protein